MFTRFSRFVARHPLVVIAAWAILFVVLRQTAPLWDSITHDGDLAYLPKGMPSVVGEKLLEEAFPYDRAKSQIVIMVSRNDGTLGEEDVYLFAYDLARRFTTLSAREDIRRLRATKAQLGDATTAADRTTLQKRFDSQVEAANDALKSALALDQGLFDFLSDQKKENGVPKVFHNVEVRKLRLALFQLTGEKEKAAAEEKLLASSAAAMPTLSAEESPLPLLDVWTWRDRLVGLKLGRKHKNARLIVLQLSNEFMATHNIRVMEAVERQLEAVRTTYADVEDPPLISVSGSAAVGADMLRASRDSIKHTELVTIILVVGILLAVYRSPLLVAVPLITIAISLGVSTRVVSLLTQLNQVDGFGWWDLKVFSTTKIFIVVILFGAGTDYCLFLIARFREELSGETSVEDATVRSLSKVGDALVASALTTIVGLGMMFFADFGKFHYSGPVIGLCLATTLLTSLTLTPALLRLFGKAVFWPDLSIWNRSRHATEPAMKRFWTSTANWIIRAPGLTLLVSVLLLMPFAVVGLWSASRVSYDILASLPGERPSKRGTLELRKHFPVGESGPITVIAKREEGTFDSKSSGAEIRRLSDVLRVPGVRTVRSSQDPLGRRRRGLALRDRVLRAPRRIKAVFVTSVTELAGRVVRFEIILDHDPFSPQAMDVLSLIDERLQLLSQDPDSFWNGTTFAFAGTTAGIRDLKTVTRSDNVRIEILVVLAVLTVLLVIVRRPVICCYMVLTVLFTYFVTMGATELMFRFAYGPDFQGLDWKVPLFLFVILVAVGQDYNVYLATRVFEEQRRWGPLQGLKRAVIQTGGIITSCGVIMAGTFFSMTSGSWKEVVSTILPSLRQWLGTSTGSLAGILELGFALSLGVALDTFIVRPLLVPAFIAVTHRGRPATPSDETPETETPEAGTTVEA